MRHRMRSSKLGRTSAHRQALYRNLVTSLLAHERIETTDAKAKQLRRLADRMITLGKRGTLHARRRALRVIRSRDVASKVFGDLAERYRDRAGGYTRVLKLRQRPGDNAAISLVELVDAVTAGGPAPRRPRGKAAAGAEAPKGAKRRAKGEKAAREDKAGKAAARAVVKSKPAPQKPAPKTKGRGRRGDS